MFFTSRMQRAAAQQVRRTPWARGIRADALRAAEPWRAMSDDALWALPFGAALPRAWMVWSNGYCPACRQSVPMYAWLIDALREPWKVRCPHCRARFPTNNFAVYHRAGLDATGVFDPARAEREFLFNAEHPDPGDPLHRFGVDDGWGYAEGDRRWMFIGAYLIYGQWKQLILGGLKALTSAYLLSGRRVYAHKAMVLLDRVADLYPTYDFLTQATCYEKQYPTSHGYVSMWHDACEETREMALCYDMVRDGVRDDAALVAFLSDRARAIRVPLPKTCLDDIRRNIEDRILRDALAHPKKIETNVPRGDCARAVLKAVLGWPVNRAEVLADIDRLIETHLGEDGVTGEKGIDGYASFAVRSLAEFLQYFERAEPGFLRALIARHPRLRRTWRFFLDTWCLMQYYPSCGDAGHFAARNDQYAGVALRRPVVPARKPARHLASAPTAAPSMFSFLWSLHELTGDDAYVQVMARANGGTARGLPWDIFHADGARVARGARAVLRRVGPEIRAESVDLSDWHLAILRAGEGAASRAAWLDYDSGNRHAHLDGMNLGLYAFGLDLLPDFGYPPVQFGGWNSPRSRWYMATAAHHTVTVDGRNQVGMQFDKTRMRGIGGRTTLWGPGRAVQVLRASGANLYAHTRQYERTVTMIGAGERGFYLVDLFRVVGGSDHAKFLSSHFGRVVVHGLNLKPAEPYGYDAQLRAFRCDPAPAPGWSVDWTLEDRHGYLGGKRPPHLRYTDLTTGAEAGLCEAWITAGHFNASAETWIPRVCARRRGGPELASTFVATLDPYEGRPLLRRVRRLPLASDAGDAFGDATVAVEATLADGTLDLVIAADVENPLGLRPAAGPGVVVVQRDWRVRLDGEWAVIRRRRNGALASLALGHCRRVEVDDWCVELADTASFVELAVARDRIEVVSGAPAAVARITRGRRVVDL